MINQSSMQLLFNAIQIFDTKVDKNYLLGYRAGQKDSIKTVAININRYHFWHLLGCELDKKQLAKDSINKEDVYADCLQGLDISKYINYKRAAADVNNKYNTFVKVFDFVKHASMLRICEKVPTFELFSIGAGSTAGLIGYDIKDNFYFPKTTYTKSIYDVDPKACKKICYILSKPKESKLFDTIEYEIVAGIYDSNEKK